GLSGSTVDFDRLLFGDTVVSFHIGAAVGAPGGISYNGTALFRFDAGTAGLDTFLFNLPGLSNARLYSTGTCTVGPCGPPPPPPPPPPGVPEPGVWTMMI